jgi:hypothetical protein
METIITSTNSTRGQIRFEDSGDNVYKVTVSNGLPGERAATIEFAVSKEEVKRLGKAS